MDSLAFSQSVVDNAFGLGQPNAAYPTGGEMAISMLESMPGLSTTIGHMTNRGANTILRGPHRQWIKPKGPIKMAMANNNPLNPRYWTRMRTAEPFGITGAVGRRYSPFQFADFANYIGRGLSGDQTTMLGRKLPTGMHMNNAIVHPGSEIMTRGTLSRITAAGKIGWMSDAQFARMNKAPMERLLAGHTPLKLNPVNIAMGNARNLPSPLVPTLASRAEAQGALLAMGGTVSGRIGGFMASVAGSYVGEVGAHIAGRSAASGAGYKLGATWGHKIGLQAGAKMSVGNIMTTAARTAKGFSWAGKAATAGRTAGLVAGRLALMATPLMPLMTAWMVYDLTKLAVKSVGYTASMGVQAHASFRGGLSTPIGGGLGHVDTEVSQTSRQRGVMAIANSRLNARSVLGTEAASMASHFG